MDYGSLIGTASASVRLAVDAGRALLDARDGQKAAAIQFDFTKKLTDAQAQLLQVLHAAIEQERNITVLEQRIRLLEVEKAEKGRYELAKLGSRREFFAYRLRSAAELQERGSEAAHFVCQPCFDGDKKVVLTGNGEGYWWCPVCKHGAQVEPEVPWRDGARAERRT